MRDRHENKNWEFRKSKEEGENIVRLYRNRQSPNIFKRVTKRCGTSTSSWDSIFYTNSILKDRFGKLTWVSTQKELDTLAERIADQELVYKQLEETGVTWTAEAYA